MKETLISCVVEGVTLAGTWSVADGMVIVRTEFGKPRYGFVRVGVGSARRLWLKFVRTGQ
jgi:hypothetical protein